MTTKKNLLVELFVEELPPKALKKLGEAFAGVLRDQLVAQGLADAGAVLTAFASPRRLAAHLTDVSAQAADKAISQKLMPVSVGLDASRPADAGPAQEAGGRWAPTPRPWRASSAPSTARPKPCSSKAPPAARRWPRACRRRCGEAHCQAAHPQGHELPARERCELPGWTSVSFVRPAHGLVALHGSEVRERGSAGPEVRPRDPRPPLRGRVDPVVLRDADSYALQLIDEGAVIAGFEARRAEIARQLAEAAVQVGAGSVPIDDDALLDEVTALVERPNVLVCEFEREFLDVPQECLILTMKANQKYFPLLDAHGKLTQQVPGGEQHPPG